MFEYSGHSMAGLSVSVRKKAEKEFSRRIKTSPDFPLMPADLRVGREGNGIYLFGGEHFYCEFLSASKSDCVGILHGKHTAISTAPDSYAVILLSDGTVVELFNQGSRSQQDIEIYRNSDLIGSVAATETRRVFLVGEWSSR